MTNEKPTRGRGRKTARPSARAKRKPSVTPEKMRELIRTGKVRPHYAVAKADGDDAVQAWIRLLPEWQSATARKVDAIVTKSMPGAHKAVRWHALWYGVPGAGWFLAIGSFKAHLKLVFFDGASLAPPPPVGLATKPQRALDVREDDAFDGALLARWVKQAVRLPGWGKA